MLERRKDALISGLWANSNYDSPGDGKPAPRTEAIEQVEANFDQAVRIVMTHRGGAVEVEEQEDKYGFFAAGERGLKKVLAPRNDEGTVEEVIAEYAENDQS